MSLLIHNTHIITNDDQNTILEGHAVAIEGARVNAIGKESTLKEKYTEYEQIDGCGRLLLPGWVNTHMHFYGTFARGLANS